MDDPHIERRLSLVEDRQAQFDTRQNSFETALANLRKDLAETERRLVDRVDLGMNEIRHTIQVETSSIEGHLTSQDANMLGLTEKLAATAADNEARKKWPPGAVVLITVMTTFVGALIAAIPLFLTHVI